MIIIKYNYILIYQFRSVKIAENIKSKTGNKLKDFKTALENGPNNYPELVQLKNDVIKFASKFPTIGF